MNMVVAEMLIASYGLPVDFAATYTYGWKLGKEFCIATGFILTTSGQLCSIVFFDKIMMINCLNFSGTVSILTLAALSCQRYLTIINPDRFKVTSYKSAFSIIANYK